MSEAEAEIRAAMPLTMATCFATTAERVYHCSAMANQGIKAKPAQTLRTHSAAPLQQRNVRLEALPRPPRPGQLRAVGWELRPLAIHHQLGDLGRSRGGCQQRLQGAGVNWRNYWMAPAAASRRWRVLPADLLRQTGPHSACTLRAALACQGLATCIQGNLNERSSQDTTPKLNTSCSTQFTPQN